MGSDFVVNCCHCVTNKYNGNTRQNILNILIWSSDFAASADFNTMSNKNFSFYTFSKS